MKKIVAIILFLSLFGCDTNIPKNNLKFSKNILNYHFNPQSKFDKHSLIFSDQGACNKRGGIKF